MGRARTRRTDAEKAAIRAAAARGPTLLQRFVSIRRFVQFSTHYSCSRCLQCVGACPTGALSLGLVRLGGGRRT